MVGLHDLKGPFQLRQSYDFYEPPSLLHSTSLSYKHKQDDTIFHFFLNQRKKNPPKNTKSKKIVSRGALI